MLTPTTVAEIDLFFKSLIYGPEGSGKTQWTAENVPNPVWIDFERSTDTLKKIGMDHIPVVSGAEHTIVEIHKFVMAQCKKPDYETLVIDTMSSAQITQLSEHMNNKFAATDDKRLLPLYQDFRVSTQLFNEMLLALQHAKMHVVLIAHERENYVGDGDMKRLASIGPSLTPALQDSTRQLVSSVLRLEAKFRNSGTERVMLVNRKGLYVAKNRYGINTQEVQNPTWATFMDNESETVQ